MSHTLRHLIILVFGLIPTFLVAQENWSLQKSVDYATENNLQVKLAETNIKQAELNLQQNRENRLPSLSGSINAGYQFGRSINPVTNSFISNTFFFNGYSISSGVNVFAGGRNNRQVRQSKFDVETAQWDAKVTENNIALSVANAYLNTLLAIEQTENVRKRLSLSEEQLAQTDRLINAGSLPENERLDILAQIAINEQSVIDAQNLVDINLLSFKNLLQLNPQDDIQLRVPTVDLPPDLITSDFTFLEVYNRALQTQPGVKAADLRTASAQAGEEVARSAHYPSVFLSGSMSTNYSRVSALGDLNVPYSEQLDQNFGQSVSVGLNIPIYNNGRNRIGVQRAKIGTENAMIQREQTVQQLRTDIQQALTSFRTARESYAAAQRSLDASQAAFDNAQRRFDLGGINSFELSTSRNNLDVAQIELTRAKYRLLFNYNVVRFYLGEELRVD